MGSTTSANLVRTPSRVSIVCVLVAPYVLPEFAHNDSGSSFVSLGVCLILSLLPPIARSSLPRCLYDGGVCFGLATSETIMRRNHALLVLSVCSGGYTTLEEKPRGGEGENSIARGHATRYGDIPLTRICGPGMKRIVYILHIT